MSKMSKDRVRIFIGSKYLQKHNIYMVLENAFGIQENTARNMYQCKDGFYVICRPSQFARFMIFRDQANIDNGFKDLRVEHFVPKDPEEVFCQYMRSHDLDVGQAREVLGIVGSSLNEFKRAVVERCNGSMNFDSFYPVMDVSGNPYCPD